MHYMEHTCAQKLLVVYVKFKFHRVFYTFVVAKLGHFTFRYPPWCKGGRTGTKNMGYIPA